MGLMKAWEIQNAYGLENLREAEKPEPKPSAGEIVVAMKAARRARRTGSYAGSRQSRLGKRA